MSKLKIEKSASKVRRSPLKATIDGAMADDLALMCEWSENDTSYLVNLLLGFAIAQSEDFQKYKAKRIASPIEESAKPGAGPSRKAPGLPGVSASQEKGVSA
jgi:hypothetical protein